MIYTKEELATIGKRIVSALERNFDLHKEQIRDMVEEKGYTLVELRKMFLEDAIETLLFECNNSGLLNDFEALLLNIEEK